jgi:hypothetical protein
MKTIINEIKAIKDHIEECLAMTGDNNLKQIKQDIENGTFGGQYVNENGRHYYVVAACSTIEDYYWVRINRDREIQFSSCVGVPGEVLSEIPADMSVLDYLLRWEAEDVAEKVYSYIDSTGHDVLFTKVNIKGKLY